MTALMIWILCIADMSWRRSATSFTLGKRSRHQDGRLCHPNNCGNCNKDLFTATQMRSRSGPMEHRSLTHYFGRFKLLCLEDSKDTGIEMRNNLKDNESQQVIASVVLHSLEQKNHCAGK